MQSDITRVIGAIPNRMAFAGGWIDQPFVSRHNPAPPGSMVVVVLEPTFRSMDRAGMASGTRAIALKLWGGALPEGDPAALVKELYAEENCKVVIHNTSPTRQRGRIAASPSLARRASVRHGLVPEESRDFAGLLA